MRRNKGFFGKLFTKNGAAEIAVMGLFGFLGFAGAKFAGNLVAKGIARLSGGVPAAAPLPAAGFGSIEAMSSPLGSMLAALVGIPLTLKFVQDPEKRNALLVGQTVSLLHSVVVAALNAVKPGSGAVLSGDDTAVRLAAMYGVGGGTSIMPHYAQVNPTGEYLTATGEYYPGVSGLGEYFDSGVEGLANYSGNQDIMQAAAGYGASELTQTNHIDPSSDLDRELTIAEAAAGIGSNVYQAAAGMRGLPPYAAQAGHMGEYFAQNGLGGNVGIAPAADTWIPGMSDPQLWAGTRPIESNQEQTAMVPAGVLSSGGSQGVFG